MDASARPAKPIGKPMSAKGGGTPPPAKSNGSSKPPPVAPGKGASVATGASSATKPTASKGKAKVAPTTPPVPEAPIVPRKLPKGGPSKGDLKRYRDLLITMRRDLLASSRDLEAEVLKSSGSEFSVDHMADNGSDNYEQDFSLKLLEGEGEQLAEIRDALLKIDGKLDPPFGVCEPCSDEDQKLCPTCPWIPAARLEAMPHARMCVQTKELDEKRRG